MFKKWGLELLPFVDKFCYIDVAYKANLTIYLFYVVLLCF